MIYALKNNILPINFKSLTVRWWSLYFNDLNCKISWKRDSERFILLGFPKVNVFVHLVCQVKFKLDQYVQTIYWLFYNSSLSECLLCFSSITCFFFFCLFRIDEHFKTSPKIPGIDLNSTRVLFEKLMNSQHSMILEQVFFYFYKVYA